MGRAAVAVVQSGQVVLTKGSSFCWLFFPSGSVPPSFPPPGDSSDALDASTPQLTRAQSFSVTTAFVRPPWPLLSSCHRLKRTSRHGLKRNSLARVDSSTELPRLWQRDRLFLAFLFLPTEEHTRLSWVRDGKFWLSDSHACDTGKERVQLVLLEPSP